jgi:hypothetical protein
VRREELPRHHRRYEEEVEAVNALRPLLSGIVDYAGLFPPAGLDMAAAVANYASYLGGPDAWMLGRFVVPVSRLQEFAARRAEASSNASWRISALLGADAIADIAAAREFNKQHREHARIDTLEGKLASTSAIATAAERAGDDFELFVEIPLTDDSMLLIAAIRQGGVAAKIRTGGITADAFPRAREIIRFMRACLDARVPFKATAGLHHPLRAEYQLTYEANAPRGMMYGYLNVFLAAAFLAEGLSDAEACDLLEERDRNAIEITDAEVRWRVHRISAEQLAAAREHVATSFGSCSFREPVDEARSLAFLS